MDNVETQNQLNCTIKQLLLLKFVTQSLLKCKPKMMQLPDELESIENSLRVLRVREYLSLNQSDDSSLNLGDYCESFTLSYTAQKAAQEQLIRNLRYSLVPIVEFIKKMQSDLPEYFEVQMPSESNINGSCGKLLNLETQRRASLLRLGELKNQKIGLMKTALELKLGPYVRNELEILHAEMRLNNRKANLMCSYLINHTVTQSEHSLKAIKEVEGFIDKKLDGQNDEQKSEKI